MKLFPWVSLSLGFALVSCADDEPPVRTRQVGRYPGTQTTTVETQTQQQTFNPNVPPSPPPPVEEATTSEVAAAPAPKTTKGDLPYGIPVPNKPGFVTSPFAPNQGYVDVRGFPPGTEVKDPYTQKIFLVP